MKKQIHQIFKKGRDKNTDTPESQEMLALFHSPENEFTVKEKLLDDLSLADSDNTSASPDFKSIFKKVWTKIEETKPAKKTNVRYLSYIGKIAAAVVIGIVAGVYAMHITSVPKEPVYYASHSPKGSISEMILPDGSVIFLNADSRVKYSVEGENGNREVFLEGEAWFDVKKDDTKPFVVHTSYYDVNVTGTQFNVKAYEADNEIATTLEEGQIIIQSTGNFKLAEDIVVKPGEQVKLNKNTKQLTILQVNTKWFTSWKDNKLVFVNMNMKDLELLLERKYGVEIEIKNKDILNLHFDGTIKNESIIEFLEIIKKALPINYKIVGQKIEITDNKK